MYSCSKASASIDGIGTEPYAIKIVPTNKKRKAHKNGEERGNMEMVSGWAQHMCKLYYVSYLITWLGSLLFGRCTYIYLFFCRKLRIEHLPSIFSFFDV